MLLPIIYNKLIGSLKLWKVVAPLIFWILFYVVIQEIFKSIYKKIKI